MGVFEDFSRFLETRLEEFLRDNPHLELMALEEQLYQQEEDAINLLAELQTREQHLKDQILETAQDVQRWHGRVEKAKAAQRFDLVKPAEEREAALLRQGNQLWGQMQLTKERIQQAIALQNQIQQRRKEVQSKRAEAEAVRTSTQTEQTWQATGWSQKDYTFQSAPDPLEATFQRWEMDEELDHLKRKQR
jgi:uncharacterized protein (TIGR04376 family)